MKVPEIHKFFKALLAYLDTLMYVFPFYRARVDDSCVTAKIDEHFEYKLKRYSATKHYDGLHAYITKKMSAWLKRFPHKDNEDYEDPDRRVVHEEKDSREMIPPAFEASDEDELEGQRFGDGKRRDERDSSTEESEKESAERK